MTTDEIMALGGQLVARNVRQLQGLGSEAETRESYVALQSAIEALQADAARYRWIRDRRGCPFAETDEAWDVPEIFERDIDASMALDKP